MASTHEAKTIQNRVYFAKQAMRQAGKQLKRAHTDLQKATSKYNREQARLLKATEELEELGISERQGSFEVDEYGQVLPRKAHVKQTTAGVTAIAQTPKKAKVKEKDTAAG